MFIAGVTSRHTESQQAETDTTDVVGGNTATVAHEANSPGSTVSQQQLQSTASVAAVASATESESTAGGAEPHTSAAGKFPGSSFRLRQPLCVSSDF